MTQLQRIEREMQCPTGRIEYLQSDAALWELYRSIRSSYQQVCTLLVERGILAEMPKDLDKPIKV